MKLQFELSKNEIIGMASVIGASEKSLEAIEKYIAENDLMEVNYFRQEKGNNGMRNMLSALAVTQICKNLNV